MSRGVWLCTRGRRTVTPSAISLPTHAASVRRLYSPVCELLQRFELRLQGCDPLRQRLDYLLQILRALLAHVPTLLRDLCAARARVGVCGARGRSRTDTLLRAVDFHLTSAFAALSVAAQVRGLEHAFTMAIWL